MESIEFAEQAASHVVPGLGKRSGKPKTVHFSRFRVEFTTFCANEYDRTPFRCPSSHRRKKHADVQPLAADETPAPDDLLLTSQ